MGRAKNEHYNALCDLITTAVDRYLDSDAADHLTEQKEGLNSDMRKRRGHLLRALLKKFQDAGGQYEQHLNYTAEGLSDEGSAAGMAVKVKVKSKSQSHERVLALYLTADREGRFDRLRSTWANKMNLPSKQDVHMAQSETHESQAKDLPHPKLGQAFKRLKETLQQREALEQTAWTSLESHPVLPFDNAYTTVGTSQRAPRSSCKTPKKGPGIHPSATSREMLLPRSSILSADAW